MELLLLSHVVLFTASLALAGSGTVASAAGHKVSQKIMRTNLVITSLGIVSGLILLISKPLGIYCNALLAYVALFVWAQLFMTRRNQRLLESSDA